MRRHRLAIACAAAVVWAALRAGSGGGRIVNPGGWPNLAEFWSASVRPELAAEFLRLTIDAASVTLGYAVVGSLLAVVLGIAGAFVLSERLWPTGPVRPMASAALAGPRAVHEAVWAILLIQVFGFDPLVGVLAIGLPFGAVTAKVFAEAVDEADPVAYERLRASGASRIAALTYGIAPVVRGELLSYSFYRLECAIRSAAVLGIVGAGGLGFQLDLSFESLRYREIWTLIAALMVLSGIADAWSSHVRRRSSPAVGRRSLVAAAFLVVVSIRWTGLDLGVVLDGRWWAFADDLVSDLLRPAFGAPGSGALWAAAVDTIAMSVLALAMAAVGGLALALVSARTTGRIASRTTGRRVGRLTSSAALLLARAVPAPVWAFLAVLVLFPGPWPGAVALGIYNLGVLGRLFAEVLEETEPRAADLVRATGAPATVTLAWATLPLARGRLISVLLYRWEVMVRETIVVGVVGAGGLGQLMAEHLAARDFTALSSAMLAIVGLSWAIDAISRAVRRALRTRSPAALGT